MSRQPPPASIASAVGPCPTIIQISRTPRHWKFTQHHRTTRPPPSFPEARKIVESYSAAPGKSYASIMKTAGVTVSCVDAATQTDPVLITAAPQYSSYNAASAEASTSSQRAMSETLTQKENQKQEKI